MKKTVILYQSKYGSTKKYAEALGNICDWTDKKYLEPIIENVRWLWKNKEIL